MAAGLLAAVGAMESVVGVKLAPFDQYPTIEALRGIVRADPDGRLALFTGNDDTIHP